MVWLHRLVTQVKTRGFGSKSVNPVQSQLQNGTMENMETRQKPSPARNVSLDDVHLSEEERKMLDQVSRRKIKLVRSKSLNLESQKEKRVKTSSRSCGSSPVKELGKALDWQLERSRVLDVMDGLDSLGTFPNFQYCT